MDEQRAAISHVLRRMALGPHPARMEQFSGFDPAAVVEQLLSEAPADPGLPQLGSGDDYARLPQWWLDVMSRPTAGLHERMVWNWHGLLTSSFDKASPGLMLRQHQLLREHALGNFRELLQAITLDAAMLYWLDGAGSTSEAPNENYAREAMELFALGHNGGYSEADVAAAALALSGWWVDGDHGDEVLFDPDSGPQQSATFLGRTVGTAAEVIDAICDQPSCARHVAGWMYDQFHGVAPQGDTLDQLAGDFSAGGLEILPLVEAVVRQPDFLEHRSNRPRSAVEWWIAARHLFDVELDWYYVEQMGQIPFSPPNVAGWPGQARWVSAGAELAKASIARDNSSDTATLDPSDPVADVLTRAGLFEPSEETVAALQSAAGTLTSRRDLSSALHALVACSPEFSLA